MSSRPASAGLTLIELLIVIAVVAILAAAMMPDTRSSLEFQLDCAARVLASDLAYARSLAVTNSSEYRVAFDTTNNRYILEHSGTNHSLDTLPNSIFRNPTDPEDQHIVNLAELPGATAPVRLARAVHLGGSVEDAADVEFGDFGETTTANPTVVLLTAGDGSQRRRMFLSINPVTGLIAVGQEAAEIDAALADEIDN